MLLWQSRGNRESELAHLIQFAKVGAGETAKTVVSPDLRTSTVQFDLCLRRTFPREFVAGGKTAGRMPALPGVALPAGSSAVGCSFGNNLDSGRERLHWHPEADRQRLRLT